MNSIFKRALGEYGITEIVGGKHNPEILKYFKEIGHEWVKDDETSWCAAFVNWCAKMEGYEYTGKLNARSFLDIGEKVEIPQMGDIVIFWRNQKDSWQGHVALYVKQDRDNIWVLGGNQSNKVGVNAYPKSQLLGYRRLNKK